MLRVHSGVLDPADVRPENILVADSSKWLSPSTVDSATWNSFDAWVTDKNPRCLLGIGLPASFYPVISHRKFLREAIR